MSGNAGIAKPDLHIGALAAAKHNSFVRNCAEALDPLDRLFKHFRRGGHIVEQANRAQIELLR